jgi:hypothetical protein
MTAMVAGSLRPVDRLIGAGSISYPVSIVASGYVASGQADVRHGVGKSAGAIPPAAPGSTLRAGARFRRPRLVAGWGTDGRLGPLPESPDELDDLDHGEQRHQPAWEESQEQEPEHAGTMP